MPTESVCDILDTPISWPATIDRAGNANDGIIPVGGFGLDTGDFCDDSIITSAVLTIPVTVDTANGTYSYAVTSTLAGGAAGNNYTSTPGTPETTNLAGQYSGSQSGNVVLEIGNLVGQPVSAIASFAVGLTTLANNVVTWGEPQLAVALNNDLCEAESEGLPVSGLVRICLPVQSVSDCDGNLSEVEALPTVVNGVVDVRICPECVRTWETVFLCVTEDVIGGGAGGRDILTGEQVLANLLRDCDDEGSILAVKYFDPQDPTFELGEVPTGDCPSSPETVGLGCITDSKGVQWEIYQAQDIDGNEVDPPGTWYIDEDGNLGVPSGESSEWTACCEKVEVCKLPGPTIDCGVATDFSGQPIVVDDLTGIDPAGNPGVAWWGLASEDGNTQGTTGPFAGTFPWTYLDPVGPGGPYGGFRWGLSPDALAELGCTTPNLQGLTIRYTFTPEADADVGHPCDWLATVTVGGVPVAITPTVITGPVPTYGGPFFPPGGYCYESTPLNVQQVHEYVLDDTTGLTLADLVNIRLEIVNQSLDQIRVDNIEFIPTYDVSECPPGIEDVPLTALCGDTISALNCDGTEQEVRRIGHVTVSGANGLSVPVCIVPEPVKTTEIISRCVDGDQAGFTDGQEVWVQLCKIDGEIIGTSLINPADSTEITELITLTDCTDPPSTDVELIRCVVDEEGTIWNEYTPITDGMPGTPFYTNEATGNIGTPVGEIGPCPSEALSDYATACPVDGQNALRVHFCDALVDECDTTTCEVGAQDATAASPNFGTTTTVSNTVATISNGGFTVALFNLLTTNPGGIVDFVIDGQTVRVWRDAITSFVPFNTIVIDYSLVPEYARDCVSTLAELEAFDTTATGDSTFNHFPVTEIPGELENALRTKDCQNDRRDDLLQEIADNIGGDTTLEIPTTTVTQWHEDSSYDQDIEAHPFAFPEGYIPSINVPGSTVTYYQGGNDYNGPNAANYGNDNGSEGAQATKVWFPESAVVPVEQQGDFTLEIPTTSVWDYTAYQNSGNLSGFSTTGPYTSDIDALPVAFPADYVPAVYLPNNSVVNYNQGNGNTGQAEVAAKVWFPESAVVPVEFSIGTITVWNYQDSTAQEPLQYTQDVEALPVAFPEDYVAPVQLIEKRNQEYYQGDGNTGLVEVDARVALPSSMVMRTEEQLPTVTIVDFDGNDITNQDLPLSEMVAGGYTTDVTAMPIAVEAGQSLPVTLNGFEQEYYAGDGNTSSTTVNSRVAFPESAVIKTEGQPVTKTLTSQHIRSTGNTTIPAGFLSATIQVISGEVTVNGAVYNTCTPIILPPQSHGDCRIVYPAHTIAPSGGAAEYVVNYQTI